METIIEENGPKYTSSQQTDESEMNKHALELGQSLVDELGLEDGVDTLSRWMAHYVAEQMAIAERASDEKKKAAGRRCFETILKLWERRASYPQGKRPFERFEAVFKALESLAPGNGPRRSVPSWTRPEKGDDGLQPEVKKWLDTAQAVDDSANTLIRYCLAQAYDSAATDEVEAWIQRSTDIGLGDDTAIITQLSALGEEFDTGDEKKDKNESLRKELKSVLAILESFENGVQALIHELEQ
jgi:hypothetical protein